MGLALVPTHKFPGNEMFLPTLQIMGQLLAPADRFLSGSRGRYPHPPRTMGKSQHPLVNFLVGRAIHTFLGQSLGFQHPLMDFPVVEAIRTIPEQQE